MFVQRLLGCLGEHNAHQTGMDADRDFCIIDDGLDDHEREADEQVRDMFIHDLNDMDTFFLKLSTLLPVMLFRSEVSEMIGIRSGTEKS